MAKVVNKTIVGGQEQLFNVPNFQPIHGQRPFEHYPQVPPRAKTSSQFLLHNPITHQTSNNLQKKSTYGAFGDPKTPRGINKMAPKTKYYLQNSENLRGLDKVEVHNEVSKELGSSSSDFEKVTKHFMQLH